MLTLLSADDSESLTLSVDLSISSLLFLLLYAAVPASSFGRYVTADIRWLLIQRRREAR